MDFKDGELHYKSVISFKNERLTKNWIRNAIMPAISMVDKYSPGLPKSQEAARPQRRLFADVEPGGTIRDSE